MADLMAWVLAFVVIFGSVWAGWRLWFSPQAINRKVRRDRARAARRQ